MTPTRTEAWLIRELLRPETFLQDAPGSFRMAELRRGSRGPCWHSTWLADVRRATIEKMQSRGLLTTDRKPTTEAIRIVCPLAAEAAGGK
jgi:hypothetical protein